MRNAASARVPKYRLHKSCGLAVVRLNGQDIYLGKHGTPESHERYRRVIAEWLSSPHMAQASALRSPDRSQATIVNELVLAFLNYARSYYVKNDQPTGEFRNIKDALRQLVKLYGTSSATEFGPVALKVVRQAMIETDLSRGVINARVNRIRRMFKWAVENQCIPASVLHGLQAVAPLKRGRTAVRETEPIRPVSDAAIEATIKNASPQIGAMIELQRLTGMRPGELVVLRTCDLDLSGNVWVYRPAQHKTEHHGKSRVIYLGPRAQQVLRPYLKPEVGAYVFSPQDALAERHRLDRMNRKSPLTPSQLARARKAAPKWTAGHRYTTLSYGRAIVRACDRAFPHPLLKDIQPSQLAFDQRHDLLQWRRKHRWSPNRLRHSAATFLRSKFGLEAAQVVLGHSSAGITEIYAERDLSRAAEIMERVG